MPRLGRGVPNRPIIRRALPGMDDVVVVAPLGVATASGFSPIETVEVDPGLGTASASGLTPASITISIAATLGVATGSGFGPVETVEVDPGVGAAAASGFSPSSITVTILPPLGVAAASGFSPAESEAITALLGTAAAIGLTPIVTVEVDATLGTAAALGFGPAESEAVAAGLGIAAAAGLTPAVSIRISAVLGLATASGFGPGETTEVDPGVGTASAVGLTPTMLLRVSLETWDADESQKLNVDIRLAGNLLVAPKLIAAPVGLVIANLERVSETYPSPALDVATGMPAPGSWNPSSVLREDWGRWQIVVDGVDVTFFRGHAVQLGTITYNEPFGDEAVDITFGMIGPWEAPGAGALSWMVDGAPVEIYHVNPDGTVDRAHPLFEGRYLVRETAVNARGGSTGGGGAHGEGSESSSFSRTMHCIGAIYAADLFVKTPALSLPTVIGADSQAVTVGEDVRSLVGDELDGRISSGELRLGFTTGDPTGIKLASKGSGTQLVNGYFQDLLGQSSVSPLPTPGWLFVGMSARVDDDGYWLAAEDGTVVAFNSRTPYVGSMAGRLNVDTDEGRRIVGMARTPSGQGYWLVGADGGVFAFGDAGFFGSMGGSHLNAEMVAMRPTSTGLGYWLFGADGGVFAFGDAGFHGAGPMDGLGHLDNGHLVVGAWATTTNLGYWLVSDLGEVYAFGDAVNHGGENFAGFVGMAGTSTDGGYWLVANDGGVFNFGDAGFFGSEGGSPINAPMCGIFPTADDLGYWTVAEDGGVFAFGDATFRGAVPGNEGEWQGWTMAKLPGRSPSVQLKDRWRTHATMRVGQPGLAFNLQLDRSVTTSVIYGDGTDDNGHQWRNTKYPNLRPGDPPVWPGITLRLGTVDASVETWLQAMHDAGWKVNVGTEFDGLARDTATAFQRANGLEVTGTVGAQTWAGTFVTGSDSGNLGAAYVAPLVELPTVEPFLYDAFGAIVDTNPAFDPLVPRVERWESFGEHVSRESAKVSALAELARDSKPAHVGTITLTADPNEISRYDLRAGMNFLLQDYEGADLFLHIAQVSVAWNSQGRPVTLTVDTHARDLLTVAAIRTRDRSTTDPVRRIRHSRRASRIIADVDTPWDFEAGGGIVPRFALAGGFWSVVRIPAAEAGSVVQVDLTTTGPARRFAVGIFNQPVTPALVKAQLPNPLADPGGGGSAWEGKFANELVIGWGQNGDACGYSPAHESDAGAVLNGVFSDQGGWAFRSLIPPWLWVAVYAEGDCLISGRLFPEPVMAL